MIGAFRIAAVAAFALAAVPDGSRAQEFPTKPVTLLHGFGAGGNADTMARILGDTMSKGLGQRVIIEPRPGASGTLASEALTRAAPDGHTIMMMTAAHATTANLLRNLKYDPVEDFAMLTSIGFFPYVIAVRKDHPFGSLADLIAVAKARPGAVTYTSVGVGSVPHLTGELLAAQAGVKLTHIPYRGGTAPMTDVLGGRVDVLIDTQTVSMPHISSGAARGLGVSSRMPWAGTPGVPTVASTLPDFEVMTWIGLATVKGTPAAMIARLHKEAVQALNTPEVKAKLSGLGADVRTSTPAEMHALVKSEVERWGRVIKQANIKLAE